MAWMSWLPKLSNKLCALFLILHCAPLLAQDFSDFQFKKIGNILIQADSPIDEEFVRDLIELTPNLDILTRSKLRKSIELLYSTGNFTNILVDAELVDNHVELTFILRGVYRIDSIDIDGDTGIRKGKVRKRLPLRKLEPYTPEGVLKGRDDILTVLRENGYYNARVTQDVTLFRSSKKAKIVYSVLAGTRARVSSLEILGDPAFRKDQIVSWMKSKPGEQFRDNKFARDMEKIEQQHDRFGYLEHKIGEQRKILPPPSVSIQLQIDSGKQLVLETIGYSFDEDVLRERVPIWVEHSYNDDTLDEGKRSLIDYLEQKGYYDAKVSWTKDTSGDKILIRYVVEKGTKYQVSEIEITGNEHIPDEDLRDSMQTSTKGLFGNAPLITKVFAEDQNNILSAYKLKGFLFTRFKRKEVVRLPDGKLKLLLDIEEGPQSIVSEIRIRGNQVFTTEELLNQFQQKVKEPVSEANVKTDSDFLIALYSDRGYPKMQVENRLRLSQDKTRALIEYRITEGEQIFIDRIVISGNWRTNRDVIEESLYFHEDEPLSLRKISESQSRLYALNIFDRAEIEMPRPDSLQKFQNVLIKLTEAKPYTITYGIGYQSFDRLRGIFGISNRNLFGTARTLALNTRAGFREGRFIIAYIDPQFFKNITSDLSVFAEYGERESFSFRRYGTSLNLERKLSRERTYLEVGREPEPTKSIFFRYAFENIDTDGEPLVVEPEDRPFLAIRISSVTFGAVRDNRDNAIDPFAGTYLSSSLQFSSNVLGSETDFVKTFSQAQYYISRKNTVIATSFRMGLAWGFRTTNELPLSQRFFAGGGRTIRGFEQDTAGPLAPNGEPTGGNMLAILNLEYRFPVYKALGAVIFFDYGSVFEQVTDFDFEEMRESAGIGIRYKTPIGPLTLDWGYKLDRRPGESPSEFFISVGHAF